MRFYCILVYVCKFHAINVIQTEPSSDYITPAEVPERGAKGESS